MNKLLKFPFLLVALLPVLLLACNSSRESKILGTYVKQASSEFSIAFDTLVVIHQGEQHYLIHRKTGFRRIDAQGRQGKLQYETENWNLVYDKETGRMTESGRGRVISFDVQNGFLLLGNGRYQRINEQE